MQMNRDIESRTDIRHLAPRKSDIYGTDSVFQNSSLFIAVHRPERNHHEKYMQFSPQKYPHLTKFMDKPNMTRTSFKTEGLIFWHYLKLREEDDTMKEVHIHRLRPEQIKEIETEHKIKEDNKEPISTKTVHEVMQEEMDRNDLPF